MSVDNSFSPPPLSSVVFRSPTESEAGASRGKERRRGGMDDGAELLPVLASCR